MKIFNKVLLVISSILFVIVLCLEQRTPSTSKNTNGSNNSNNNTIADIEISNYENKKAGYYVNGELVLNWQNLIDDNCIFVNGDVLNGRNTNNLSRLGDGVLVISSNIKEIGQDAFYNCKELVGVVIPDSVKEIGKNAFSLCQNLSGLIIGDGVTIIKSSTFANCTALSNVKMGKNVSSIENSAFSYCVNLKTIKLSNGCKIGYTAFYGTPVEIKYY